MNRDAWGVLRADFTGNFLPTGERGVVGDTGGDCGGDAYGDSVSSMF